MQQTSKYQFNLVEGSDDFSPTPLNQNMEKVEEALSVLNAAVETAQTTADTAQAAAETLHYVIGSYIGNGGTQDINLGFQPQFLFITAQMTGASKDASYLAITGGNEYLTTVILKSFGFTVVHGSTKYPFTNQSDRVYR